MSWNLNKETVTANQPVRMVHRQEQVTLTAKQVDLQKEVVYLTGDVHGVGQRRQSINAKALTWYLPSQLVEPAMLFIVRLNPTRVYRSKAGKIQDQTIVVSGGRVVTEIIP